MFREHGLPWKLVGFFSLALAPPGLTWAQAEQVPQGLDEALSGQVARPAEPKRETPRIVLAPEFWSPSPSQSDFIRHLRETETTKLPSADTPYPEADPNASNFRSKNPPLSPKRTIAYVALADPAPGTSLDQRCEQIRAEIGSELARIEKNGTPQGKEAIAAACVNVWARYEGARLAGMLDPTSDVYQQRLLRMRAERTPGETDPQIEERLKEQILAQHLEQLLGASAIEAEIYRQRLPQMLATRRPEETEEDIERRLSSQVSPQQRLGPPMGVGGKEIWIEKFAGDFWPHRTDGDRNAQFDKLCHIMLSESRIQGPAMERLIHYACSQEPRLTNEEGRVLLRAARGGHLEGDAKPRYQKALELVRRERKADLLMRLAEMNAWETAGRGDPEAYRQVEALMNRALDTVLATNPRAEERTQYYRTELHFTKDKAEEAVRAEFRTEFLLRLCDSARDARSPEESAFDKMLSTYPKAQERFELLRRQPDFTLEKAREKLKAEFKEQYLWRLNEFMRAGPNESDVPVAPLHPEYRVKQFVRENRLAKVTAAADKLHGVLCPMADQPLPTKEQIRDAVREACASRSQDEVNQLRDLYRERWLKGAKKGEPQGLDKEIDAKLGSNLRLRKQCEAFLHHPRVKPNEGTN